MIEYLLLYDRQYYKKCLKIAKGVIRIHKSKDKQHNGQMKKAKQRSTKH